MYPYPKPSSSGGGQKGSSSFPCHICGLEFPKRRYLRDHMRKKHSDHDIVSVADDMKVTNELVKKDVQAIGNVLIPCFIRYRFGNLSGCS